METRAQDPALAEILERALHVDVSDERVAPHIHGFHSYPARMHPDTARTLVEALSAPRDVVLDAFCGSGTVVVAARELGRAAIGSDLNPLAVELTRLKSRSIDAAFAAELEQAAQTVVEHARARQKAELGPTQPYPPEDRALFPTYVLLALDGLRDGIDRLPRRELREPLMLVLSSLLTKLSNKPGDSASTERPKRIPRTFAFHAFESKTRELVRRWLEFSALVPAGTNPARVHVADARRLDFVKPRTVTLVVSSPPYPGVYDYFAHHALRLRWLRLDARGLQRDEIGARRHANADRASRAASEYETAFAEWFRELARVLKPHGRAAMLVADSVVRGRAIFADEWLLALARRAGFNVLATASQRRPYFHGPTADAFRGRPRREHLFLLEHG